MVMTFATDLIFNDLILENASDMVVTIIYHLLTDFLKDHGAKLPRKLHLNLGMIFFMFSHIYILDFLVIN